MQGFVQSGLKTPCGPAEIQVIILYIMYTIQKEVCFSDSLLALICCNGASVVPRLVHVTVLWPLARPWVGITYVHRHVVVNGKAERGVQPW